MTQENKSTNAWGIAGLILGILSLVLFLAPYIGIVLAITAVVFYGIQKKQEITGTATGALVTGIIGIILNGIMLVFFFGMLAFLGGVDSESNDVDLKQIDTVSGENNVVKTKVDSKIEYIKNSVKLEDVELGEGYGQFDMPGYDKKKPTIQGKVRNTGDKVLETVKITVYFLDSKDIRIGEKEYYIISSYSIFGDKTPLKPNYVRDWGYIIEDAPSGWAKELEVFISDIEFGE